MAAPAYRDSTNYSGSGTSHVINKPAAVVDNDIMVAAWNIRRTGATTTNLVVTPPTGWTLIRRTEDLGVGNGYALISYWKLAASEGSSYTWTSDSNAEAVGLISAYSGAHQTTPVNIENTQVNANGTDIISPSVTTTVADTRLIYVGTGIRDTNATGAPTLTVPASTTQRQNVVFGAPAVWYIVSMLGDETQAGTGATGTRTGTISAATDSGNIGYMLAMAPPSGAAATVVAQQSHSMHPGKSPGRS